MRLGGRLFFITIIYCSTLLCESTNRHLLSLFGIRFSEKNGFRKPFWYTPVIILPSITQKQSVIIESSVADENYQENGDVFQRLTSETEDYNTTTTSEDFDRIMFDNLKNKEISKENETMVAEETINYSLRSSDNITDVTLSNNTKQMVLENATATTMPLVTTTAKPVTESQTQTTGYPKGPYSTPVYNNEFVNNLTFTTSPVKINIGSMLTLPESNDNFKNFKTFSEENSELYNFNGFLLPSDDNRWLQFSSSERYTSNQFRPIAGLYHDGFLHRPLPIRQGFVPSRQFYY